MCRNIKKRRLLDGPASRDEIEASALQYVRKVSGFRQPSARNAEAFAAAVLQISDVTQKLLVSLHTNTRRQ
jgi:hypothetical protein